MSKVAKYRRQVSEDPDIDSLLSTLSPEEMEELEKELDVVDAADGGIPPEPGQKSPRENSSAGPQNCEPTLNHHEKEGRRRIQREQSVDESRLSERKGEKNEEEKGKEAPAKDLAQKRDTKVGKDSRKEENAQKPEPKAKAETKGKEEKAINDKLKAMEKKLMGKDKKEEEKGSGVKKETGKDKKVEEKGSGLKKDEGKDKKEEGKEKKEEGKEKKEEGKEKKEEGKEKKEEGKEKKEAEKEKKEEKGSVAKKDPGKEEEKSSESKKQAEKDTKGEDKKEKGKKEEEKSSAGQKPKAEEKEEEEEAQAEVAEGKQEAKAAAAAAAAAQGSPPKASSSSEEAKEDEASSIFDELIERVKNNDAEVREVNVNNSDCISSETLVRFAEALEFNTVVKLFALANTRADDHVAFAIAIMLKSNKVLSSINLDSNHITGKGILAIFRALLQNASLTELRFHNQRHICGGKTEMEIAKLLKENTTLLKLGYHFELAGPRMTVTNLLSRNMDRQRQKRLQEQKLAQERGEKKDLLQVPKAGAAPKAAPKASPQPSPKASPKAAPKQGAAPAAPPPPPPPLAPPLIGENLRNSLSPATQRKLGDRALPAQEKNSRDQLLAAIRSSNLKQLKKVAVPKLLQ
ncbi:leiomodin-1 [Melanerpes formicivorus]|uniref:leiomodin-1 n=1 Tax=Melanerpes formicivorus TaxID=211600 RepID=UPI00358F99B2